MNATPPWEVRLKTPSNYELITPGGHHSSTTRTGIDTGTSMEAAAAPHHSGPIEPAAPIPPRPATAVPRARITSLFFSGFTPLTGTYTSTLAVDQAPTIPAAAPESPATTTSTSGEMMRPGSGRTTTGKPSSRSPRRRRANEVKEAEAKAASLRN